MRDAIYRTSKGFVAVWMHDHAVEGHFTSQAEAQRALDMLTLTNGLRTEAATGV